MEPNSTSFLDIFTTSNAGTRATSAMLRIYFWGLIGAWRSFGSHETTQGAWVWLMIWVCLKTGHHEIHGDIYGEIMIVPMKVGVLGCFRGKVW